MRVLVAEDDPDLGALLVQGLGEQHIDVTLARTYAEAWERATFGTFDIFVLDVMLPGGSGFDLCAKLRERGIGTPVLMLTARDAVGDRVRGLQLGADDYLTKPFAFQELVARVRALARRRPAFVPSRHEIADMIVELDTRAVSRSGRPIALTAKEFALLEVFVLNPDRVIGRAEITANVWDENHDPFTNVLEVLVRRLRRKIDDDFEPKLVHTVRGAGYRFGL
ncbi:MAG: response regulator transcription factor [Gemmatimonadota bacterium]|nr:response regulator transcription factor [Gemmatimonadota bacterium]